MGIYSSKQMTCVRGIRNVLNRNTFGDLNFLFLHSSRSLFNFFNYWLLYNCKHFKEIAVFLEFLSKFSFYLCIYPPMYLRIFIYKYICIHAYIHIYIIFKKETSLVLWTLSTNFCTANILVLLKNIYHNHLFIIFSIFALSKLDILGKKFIDTIKLREEVVPIGLDWWLIHLCQTSHDNDVDVLI